MSDREQAVVRFEVLGPLRARRADTALTLGSVQQRVVLGVLLLRAGRPVGREQLIDWVWGSASPAYAVNLLQKHMSGLRRALEPDRSARAPSRLLSWTEAGYLLSVPPGCLDLTVFEREMDRARAARAAGDLPGACRAMHAAAGLWRGPLCDGLASPLLDAERDRLAEAWISVTEERIELDLALGSHADLVAELRRLVADHPVRERLRGLLMEALYRSGRQPEALAVYRDTHRYLVDELGVEPTVQLRQLHQRILAMDPGLAAPPRAEPTGAVPAVPVAPSSGAQPAPRDPPPAQLPHGMPDFTGRGAELERLDALVGREHGRRGETLVITAIAGTAGVGKTSLAVHWAHQIRHRFPDGQLYVNLRGFDPPGRRWTPARPSAGSSMASPCRPSGSRRVSRRRPPSTAACWLAGGYWSCWTTPAIADQVRPLLPGSSGCLVLVTSRNRLSGLVAEGAHPVAVDLLSADEARELLARRVGRDRVAAEPEAVDEIVSACARLPLALADCGRAGRRPAHSRSPRSPTSCARPAAASTRSSARARPPTPGRCSPGRTRRWASRRPGCSGCSGCTRARTSPRRRPPAWRVCGRGRRGRCWGSWPRAHLIDERDAGPVRLPRPAAGCTPPSRPTAGHRGRAARGDAADDRPLPAHGPRRRPAALRVP